MALCLHYFCQNHHHESNWWIYAMIGAAGFGALVLIISVLTLAIAKHKPTSTEVLRVENRTFDPARNSRTGNENSVP
jgi:hypothetical protein